MGRHTPYSVYFVFSQLHTKESDINGIILKHGSYPFHGGYKERCDNAKGEGTK